MSFLGTAKKRLGARLDSEATTGGGMQNLLCAYLAAAVLAGLLANTLLGCWWLDPAIGSEGRISHLLRGYGWDRARLDGRHGGAIWCGHGYSPPDPQATIDFWV